MALFIEDKTSTAADLVSFIVDIMLVRDGLILRASVNKKVTRSNTFILKVVVVRTK